ncbi:hypothetical protein BKA64DRAFT_720485, partial [Cadophora sp. MPI-SDFR-AT-0126]
MYRASVHYWYSRHTILHSFLPSSSFSVLFCYQTTWWAVSWLVWMWLQGSVYGIPAAARILTRVLALSCWDRFGSVLASLTTFPGRSLGLTFPPTPPHSLTTLLYSQPRRLSTLGKGKQSYYPLPLPLPL